jgi:hypothetical protein
MHRDRGDTRRIRVVILSETKLGLAIEPEDDIVSKCFSSGVSFISSSFRPKLGDATILEGSTMI